MFAQMNSSSHARPLAKGLLVYAGILLVAVVFRHAARAEKVAEEPEEGPLEVTTIRLPAMPKARKPETGGGTISHEEAKKQGATVSQAVVSNEPGMKEWRDDVSAGSKSTLDIEAQGSMPVLERHGVLLALASRRPRGEARMFDLRTKTSFRAIVPEDTIPRLLKHPPMSDELREAIRKAQAELGKAVNVYALYDGELYACLRSLSEKALSKKGLTPSEVRKVIVDVALTGRGKKFSVKLIRWEEGS